MTIDERLERLTERHEALTQTVELMAAENRDRDKRTEERDKRLDGILTQMAEGIGRLLHVAEIHEPRLEDLEGK
jgi:archaellum component FlaC